MSIDSNANGSSAYWAFISYSHADERWASWLHRSLETYRLPKDIAGTSGKYGDIPDRLYPIFRDREELASGANLPARINEALAHSRALIVICSPNAVRSRWVDEEIRTFKAMHGEERVYSLIVDGVPHAAMSGVNGEECFPKPLRYSINTEREMTSEVIEPLAADARSAGDGRNDALIKLLAGLLGIELDVLRRRDERRRRQRNQLWGIAAVVVIVVLSLGIVYSNAQRQEAIRQSNLANDRQQIALARLLAAQSSRMRLEQPGAIEFATLLAVEAASRLDTLETQQALQAAMRLLPPLPFKLGEGFSMAAGQYSHDGRTALVDEGDRLYAFNVADGHLLWQTEKAHQSPLPLTPEDCCVLVLSSKGQWRILHLADGREFEPTPTYLAALNALESDRVQHLEFSSNGRWLVADAVLLQTETGSHWPLLLPYRASSLFIDPTSHWLAVFGKDDLKVINLHEGKLSWTSKQAREANLRFSPDGSLMIVIGTQKLALYETASGEQRFELSCTSDYMDATLSSDNRLLATACGNAVMLHDTRIGTVMSEFQHDRPVSNVRFSHDNKRLLSANYDQTVRIWQLSNHSEIWRAASPGYMTQALFAPNESSILGAGMGGVFLWHMEKEDDVLLETQHHIGTLAASPDSRWLAIASGDDREPVVVVDVQNGEKRRLWHLTQQANLLAFSHDNQLLVASDGEVIEVLPLTGDKPVYQWTLSDRPYSEIIGTAFSPDGELLVAIAGKSTHGYFRLDRCKIDGEAGQPRCTHRETQLPSFLPVSAFFSKDGRKIVISATQSESMLRGNLQIWDTLAEEELRLPPRVINDLSLNSEQHRMVYAMTAGGSVEIADDAGNKTGSISHEGWVSHLDLDPTGQYLAIGLTDSSSGGKNRVVIFRLSTGEEIARFSRGGDFGPLMFLPDGRHLAYSDGTRVRMVAWRVDDVIAKACARLTRNMDCNEWTAWIGQEIYRPACGNLSAANCGQ